MLSPVSTVATISNTLSIPPEEQWKESLRWLSREQRERFSSPEFFAMLQIEITKRYLQLMRRQE